MIGKCMILALAALYAAAAPYSDVRAINDRPIIGILAMELGPTPMGKDFGNYTSHIVASYVKWLEASGARVVPIKVRQRPSYYIDIIKKVNGILIPGGPTFNRPEYESEIIRTARAADAEGLLDGDLEKNQLQVILQGSGFGLGAAFLLKLAQRLNDQGVYFPVWTTCLGFQLMTVFSGITRGVEDFRVHCAADNLIAPTDFTAAFKNSRMFRDASQSIINTLQKEAVTAHFHGFCITEEVLSQKKMLNMWNILSTNKDFNGMEFISTTEAKNYPFYGVQYHPEKLGFEWNDYEQSPHDSHAIRIMQYFGNFFVNEARKNTNKFADPIEEREALIYNYQPTYTSDKSVYEQTYLFK